MPSPSRFPLRIEYVDANGALKWTEPYYDMDQTAVLLIALRAAGASQFSVFRDGAISPTPCMSYSKYPGAPRYIRPLP